MVSVTTRRRQEILCELPSRFLCSLTGRPTPPPVTGEDGRKAIEIVLAIYKSAETGHPITLSM
jgi:predicted dehydrogenase